MAESELLVTFVKFVISHLVSNILSLINMTHQHNLCAKCAMVFQCQDIKLNIVSKYIKRQKSLLHMEVV